MNLNLNQSNDIEGRLRKLQAIGAKKERLEEARITAASFEPKKELQYEVAICVDTEGAERNTCAFVIPGDILERMLMELQGNIAIGQDRLINEAKELMKL